MSTYDIYVYVSIDIYTYIYIFMYMYICIYTYNKELQSFIAICTLQINNKGSETKNHA